MSIQNGTDIIMLYEGMRIASLTSNSVEPSRAMRNTTTKDSNGWRSLEYGQGEWSASADGLVFESIQNLATRSEDFANSAWFKFSCVATKNTTVAPNGTLTGNTISSWSSSDSILQTLPSVYNATARSFTFSVWLKGTAGQKVNIRIQDDNGSSTSDNQITLKSTWERYSVTYITTGNSTDIDFGFLNIGDTATTFQAWGAQMELGSAPGQYEPSGVKWTIIREALRNKTKFAFVFSDQISGHTYASGTGTIESFSETAPLEDNRTFTVSITGDGALVSGSIS
jgi:predicted secreted protein